MEGGGERKNICNHYRFRVSIQEVMGFGGLEREEKEHFHHHQPSLHLTEGRGSEAEAGGGGWRVLLKAGSEALSGEYGSGTTRRGG